MNGDLEIRCLEVGMLAGNCYLLKCNDRGQGVIIDPGDEPERIYGVIEEMKLDPEAILLTHGHIDHTNGAGWLRKRLRCRVVCHSADSQMVRGADEVTLWGLERNPCQVDQEITGGDILNIGDKAIRVMHTPGHTEGSVCYVVDSYLFSGDTLFRGSIGRMDLPGGSEVQMMETLRNKIATLDGSTVVYPGHGPSTNIEHEKKFNPFL